MKFFFASLNRLMQFSRYILLIEQHMVHMVRVIMLKVKIWLISCYNN